MCQLTFQIWSASLKHFHMTTGVGLEAVSGLYGKAWHGRKLTTDMWNHRLNRTRMLWIYSPFLSYLKSLLLFLLHFTWTLLQTLFTLKIQSPSSPLCWIHSPISLFGKETMGTFHIWQVMSKCFVVLKSALTIISFNKGSIWIGILLEY